MTITHGERVANKRAEMFAAVFLSSNSQPEAPSGKMIEIMYIFPLSNVHWSETVSSKTQHSNCWNKVGHLWMWSILTTVVGLSIC